MPAQNTLTIQDIADHLGISKTTVSRAISGKGRIGGLTRDKVLSYCDAVGYRPRRGSSAAADRGTATDADNAFPAAAENGACVRTKSRNIAVILPNSLLHDSIFFQNCLAGIVESAAAEDYDIVIALEEDAGTTAMERIFRIGKADGAVLMRGYVDDPQIKFLKSRGIPFVLIGTTPEDIVQVDSNVAAGAKALVLYLLGMGLRRIAYVGGKESYLVSRKREEGFLKAFEEYLIPADHSLVFRNAVNSSLIGYYVENALLRGAQCIVGGDDLISQNILQALTERGVRVPEDILLASMYNSIYTTSSVPPITSVDVDPRELGEVAGKRIVSLLDGKDAPQRTQIQYNLVIRASTQGPVRRG